MPLLVNEYTKKWIRFLNQKLINNYLDLQILYYKVNINQTINPYGETENEEYVVNQPITLRCLIEKDDESKEMKDTVGILSDTITFMFMKEMLPENVTPTEGDIIFWKGFKYEISKCWDGNLWAEEKMFLHCLGNITTRNLDIREL